MATGEFREQSLTATLDSAFRAGGVVEVVAQTALVTPAELAPEEVGDIIMPRKVGGKPLPPRHELVEGARGSIKAAAIAHESEVFTLAEQLGMRSAESLPESDLARIVPESAIWVIEGGANRTSVVRRALATEAMQNVYGRELSDRYLFQVGTNRSIPHKVTKAGEVVDNPEHATVAQEIAGGFLPADDSLTEFGLNMASAQKSGYEVDRDVRDGVAAARVVCLRKAGSPALVLIQPHEADYEGRTKGGFTAVSRLMYVQPGSQLVVVTNGQYRPKVEVQANGWAADQGFNMAPPVGLGDEVEYRVIHSGQEIVTATRGPLVYVNEAVVLHRLIGKTQ